MRSAESQGSLEVCPDPIKVEVAGEEEVVGGAHDADNSSLNESDRNARKIFLGMRYIPFTVKRITRRPKYPVLIDGAVQGSYETFEITEYVDSGTGEIYQADAVPRRAVKRPIRYAEMGLQRQAVMHGLRPEVRRFAQFVLSFRDQRGGITPGMSKLVEWYADLEGRRVPDVRRYVARLEEAGICEGDCMCPLFQWFEDKEKRSHYLGAGPIAIVRFFFMKHRREQDTEAQRRRDDELVDQECSKTLELERLAA